MEVGSDPLAPQRDPSRCHVCGYPNAVDEPLVPVLRDGRGHHWIHRRCHDEHARRCAEARNSAARQQRAAA